MKKLAYTKMHAQTYFWRTYAGAELDYIEEREGTLSGYEFKHGAKSAKCPATGIQTYHGSRYELINRTNCLDFVTESQ